MSNFKAVQQTAFVKNLVKHAKGTKRGSKSYSRWRRQCLERDANKCVLCSSTAKIEVHHIVRWADNPILRYKKYNGAVLCKECHLLGHGGNGKPFKDDITLKIIEALKKNGQRFRGCSIFISYLTTRKPPSGKSKKHILRKGVVNSYLNKSRDMFGDFFLMDFNV